MEPILHQTDARSLPSLSISLSDIRNCFRYSLLTYALKPERSRIFRVNWMIKRSQLYSFFIRSTVRLDSFRLSSFAILTAHSLAASIALIDKSSSSAHAVGPTNILSLPSPAIDAAVFSMSFFAWGSSRTFSLIDK